MKFSCNKHMRYVDLSFNVSYLVGYKLGLSLQLHSYFECASSEGSAETMGMLKHA